MPSKRALNHPIKYDSIASQVELVDEKHQLTRSQLINFNLVSPLRSIQSRQGTHGSSTDNDNLLRLPHLLLAEKSKSCFRKRTNGGGRNPFRVGQQR